MRTIVLASSNKHKIKEFKEIFPNDKILSLSDINYDKEIVENGNTFLQNAIIKAKAIHDYLKEKEIEAYVIADDSGLCVNSLNGEPGIYSARYAGNNSNIVENRKKLLKKLKEKNDRSAYFICCLVEYFPNGEYISVEGRTEGYILDKETGNKTFGYDCLFFSYDLNKSFGEASSDEKNSVSHRGRAIKKLIEKEKKYPNEVNNTFPEIYISQTCGLCYGSNNAITKTKEALKEQNNVVIYKEILHNQNVMNDLTRNGAKLKEHIEEISKDDFVIIRAHGEPLSTFSYLDKHNINYLDCTCPNVKSIHHLVKQKSNEGFKIIIIGKHGFTNKSMHPEVFATAGWCDTPILIEDESEINSIDLSYDKYYLVTQTTFSKDKANIFIDKIKNIMTKQKKIFDYRNTICNAQKNINKASEELAKKVDIMIVIGGKNSSNSLELFNNLSSIKETYFIENISELLELIKKNIIKKHYKIGITAGASTMREDILEVKSTLENKLK